MKFAYYIKKVRLKSDSRVEALLDRFRAAGHVLYPVGQPSDFQPGTDVLLSLGGDGTFLSAASLAVSSFSFMSLTALSVISSGSPGPTPTP